MSTVDSRGCPGCPVCLLEKPKLCKPFFCLGLLCPFGTISTLTVQENGCPGCRVCVECEPRPCRLISCKNYTITVLENGCPGCRKCQ